MTGCILPFPASRTVIRRRETTYNFARMVELFGLEERDGRTQVASLRRLAECEGLPLPKNARYWGGKRQRGPASIGQLSIWDAAAVNAWQNGQGGNAEPARITHPANAAPGLRAAMRGRARQLKARG
tara:strand:+ start:769 stop:1149 length:381 start_codon:yes stop_codon:yes gene_type:complete